MDYQELIRKIPVGSGFAKPVGAVGYLEIKKLYESKSTIKYKSNFSKAGKKIFEKEITVNFGEDCIFTILEDDDEAIFLIEEDFGGAAEI